MTLRLLAITLGPLCGMAPMLIPQPEGLGPEAWRLIGLTIWMALWWLTECVPIPTTALLPLVWMPLAGISDEKLVAARYADPIVFLFLGGFIIAQGIEQSGLHQRIALRLIKVLGGSPGGMVAGFMIATACMSMWINNTSTTMMMFAVALPVVRWIRGTNQPLEAHNFSVSLLLGIAYAASIGGVGTLIGTAPNALLAGYLRDSYGYSLDMLRWLGIGIPFVALVLPFTWFWLVKVQHPSTGVDISAIRTSLSFEERTRCSLSQRWVGVVFAWAVIGWIARHWLGAYVGIAISDTYVALSAAVMLFVLPASTKPYKPVLDWSAAERIPWGVLILFGGGLALAGAFESTGLAKAIGENIKQIGDLPVWLIVLAFTAVIIFLTELTSNTATTATFLPVAGAIAGGLDINPLLLTIPVAVGSSAAFMLPVATPPNAIVFATGEIRITEMARAGMVLNIYCIAVVTLLTLTFAQWVIGTQENVIP